MIAERSRRARAFLRLALLLVLPLVATGDARASDGADYLERHALTRGFRSGQPNAITVPVDEREVLFLRSGPRDRSQSLWAWDAKRASEREITTAARLRAGADEVLSPEERARRERLRQTAGGLTSFEVSLDGRLVLVPYSGRLFLLTRPGYATRELGAPGLPPALDARFSPDGRSLAFVRSNELRVLDVASGAERVIARPESANVMYGLPEFVAQEEMDRFEGHWWSPDSRHLLVQRTDHGGVETLQIMDPANPTKPPEVNPYPRPGEKNDDVRLAIYSVNAGPGTVGSAPPVWVQWDRDAWPYLCRVEWEAQGPLTLQLMDRRQQHTTVVTVDPATGRTSPLFDEVDAAWINLYKGVPRWLAGGRELLWLSERDDTGPELDARGSGNAIRRLTPNGLRVRELLAFDRAHGTAWVTASDEPTETHVWRVDVAKGRARRVGADRGVETAIVAPNGGLWVRSLKPERGAPRWIVESANGRTVGEIASVAESPGVEPIVEWTSVGPDSLRAFIVRPRNFKPGHRYPVIDWAYAGPHSQRVVRNARQYLLEQWLADQGFIVVTVDGRGTPGRGRYFERQIRGDLIGPALRDHRRALTELCARHVEMDPARIGAIGWSFGGYFAAHAVISAPDVYRAGVAGAPVVDWHDYDTYYTERYLGVPPADSVAYTRSSVLTNAASLGRPLLIVHGTADDNVYFVNSLKLTAALNRANRKYEFLPLPGQTHAVSAPDQVRQYYSRALEFLQRELGGTGDTAPPRP
jgi:dipeptidyl-peptidase-4